ncbi:MAG: ParB N-terminal domain-containing protein [Firmicutes bacterium]|nr:ParB N-terminal domain-containing protein [Bacillota bacterium]
MKLEKIALEKLVPLDKNIRKHGERQIEEFVKSLKQFGQTRPFVIDEKNTVLIGNGMLEAMKRAGIEVCTAYRVKGLSDLEKKKLVLTDNKIYSLGSDNLDNIMDYLQEFADAGDFDIPGFDAEGIEALTRTAGEVLDDAMSYGIAERPPPRQEAQAYTPPTGNGKTETTPGDGNAGEQDAPPSVVCPNCGEAIRL